MVVNLQDGGIRSRPAHQACLTVTCLPADIAVICARHHELYSTASKPVETHAFPLSQYPSALTPPSRLPSTQHQTLPSPNVFDRRLYILMIPSRVSMSNLNAEPVVLEKRYVFSGRSG